MPASPSRLGRRSLALACVLASLVMLRPAHAASHARVNLAKYQPATASVQAGTYAPDFAVDGIVDNFHAYRTGNQTAPYWLEIGYARPLTIASAHLYLGLLENAAPTQVPAQFKLQYHDGFTWIDVPGGAVSGNTATEVNLVFTQAVTAARFRLHGTDDGNRAIRELALFPPNLAGGIEQGHPLGTDVRLNLAHRRPATSSSAILNNTYGAGYAKNAFDGHLDNTSRWLCANTAAGEYIEIDLLANQRVATAHVYTGFIDPADPTRATTQPMADFSLHYWDGLAWQPIPGGEITGNTQVARAVEFTEAVTTSRIRLVTTTAFNARLQELLLFPPRDGGTPLGREILNAPPPARVWDTYSDSNYRLRNRGPDQRLGFINGQVVQVTPATANAPLIEWQLLLNHRDGSYRVRHSATGLALALANISLAADTAVVAETYSGLPHQDWLLDVDPADPTRFRLLNRYSGLALQTLDDSQVSGSTMVVRPAIDGFAQQYWNANFMRHHPKKGVAATANLIRTSTSPYVTGSDLTFIEDFHQRLRGSWSYTWGRQTSDAFPFMDFPHTFNPMQWGNFNWLHGTAQGPLERIHRDLQANGKPVHLLAFNEPDKTNQGNTAVTDAIARWPRLEARDVPLVSPVPAGTFNGWQADFTAQADALGYRRDYTAVHWYAPPNADALIAHLQQAYAEFDRPVWLTEFSTVDWTENAAWSHADNYNFLAEFLWRAESLPWLKRYSVFAFIQANEANPNQSAPDPAAAPRSNTLRADGSLTPFGELYATWDGVAAVLPDRAYHLHNHSQYRRAANTGGELLGNLPPEDSGPGTQWFLSPGLTPGTHRLISTRDGRPLRYWTGGTLGLGAVGLTATSTEWRITPEQHGRHYIEHNNTNLRLANTGDGVFSMAPAGTNNGNTQWRFINPLSPHPAGPPAAPTGLATETTATAVILTWSPVPDATGYTVARSDTGADPWTTIATDITSTRWTDPDLAPETTYVYRVFATNLYALDSAVSVNASATTTPPPSPYAVWTSERLGALPSKDQATDADPDADGLPNLLEYALAEDPLSAGASPLQFQSSNQRLQITFLRARAELTYEVLASATLAPDSWTVIATNPGNVSLTAPVTVSDTVPLSDHPRRFLILRVR